MLLDRPALFIALVMLTLTIVVGSIGLTIGIIGRLFGRRRLRNTIVGSYAGAFIGGCLGAIASLLVVFPASILALGMASAFTGAGIGALCLCFVDRRAFRRLRRHKAR